MALALFEQEMVLELGRPLVMQKVESRLASELELAVVVEKMLDLDEEPA